MSRVRRRVNNLTKLEPVHGRRPMGLRSKTSLKAEGIPVNPIAVQMSD
jgi:hypothetical protein